MKRFLPLIVVGIVLLLGAIGYLTIEHYGIEALITLVSVPGIAAIIFAESGLLVGFFLPGDSLLFTAGFLVQTEIIKFNIHLLVAILFAAAVLGDNVGYAFGRKFGRRLFDRKNSVLFHSENLKRAEGFYQKHGPKTILLARFVPVVRTFAPIVAGISKMHYRTFIAYNMVGGFLWAVGLTYLGYLAGDVIERYAINVEYVILGIIFISIAPPLIHILREPSTRVQIISGVKFYLRYLFRGTK
ncbi:VTT domain-containing protein [Candidatus Saccharibacteria bacterium]|nr:VTT domain-containing protein [Candidatus Saccharibacteria bacterium]